MITLYFTATGNSLYAAKRIGGDLVSIPQAIKDGKYNFSDDRVGFVLPVYWAMIPLYVEEFLRKAKIDSQYVFAVLTYGMVSVSATTHLIRIGNDCGIKFSYINTLKMVDNYLPVYDMKKQISGEPSKKIDKNLDKIISDTSDSKKKIPNSAFFDSWVIAMMKKRELIGVGVTKEYFVENTCNGCATCVSICPMKNVMLRGIKPVFGNRCMSCLACTHNCPQNSIRLKGEKSRVRFRNQHIQLKEIVSSNK